MITALASGAFLGLSCGFAPGPLLALLLAQTLRHGPREGCKIALRQGQREKLLPQTWT